MKITRTRLTEIIREELATLWEADRDPRRGRRKHTVASADAEPTEPNPETPDGGTVKGPDASPVPAGTKPGRGADPSELDTPKDGPAGPPQEPGGEPQDDAGAEDDEQDAVDPTGTAGEEPSGAVNDEVSGKTVQAVSVEPKSKILPGAREIVLAFNESTDPLRILVTPTGMIKFFWRGQLHDLP